MGLFGIYNHPFLVGIALRVIVDVITEHSSALLRFPASQVNTAARSFVDNGDGADSR
jgi:hypothetical protein